VETLYQIGKDLEKLNARVLSLEVKGKCNCHSESSGIPISDLPEGQREILLQLRKNHKEIFAKLNDVLKQFGLGGKGKISEFHLVDINRPRPSVGAGSDDCCYCCSNEGVSGYDMCCSDDCTPCCA
jgi:hypothetical protein